MRRFWRKAMVLAAFLGAAPAAAQDRDEAERSDPAVIEQELDRDDAPRPPQPRLEVETPSPAASLAHGTVVAGAIRVTGATRIPSSNFAPAFEPFLGRPLSQDDLVRLATAVADVARRAGFGLATAWVPAQELNGAILTVRVDEGRIDALRVTGPGATLVEQRLASIVGNGPVRTDVLERQLLLAGDLAGLWVGNARLTREGNRNVLVVTTRHQRVEGRATIDNWGSDRVGPIRAWAEIDVNGVAMLGDGLTLGVATTPLDPTTFQLAEAYYRLPLGEQGTMLAVGGYVGRTDVEPEPGRAGFAGDSWELQVEAVHPLARSRKRSLWVTGRFELRDSALDRSGIAARDDRIVSATASLYGFHPLAGGRLRVRASLVQGLDLLGATRRGDPLASRSDASGVFTKVETWAEYRRPLGGGFSTEVTLRAQAADGPLLSSEEMGLGGRQFLRAFDYREYSGDQGVAASIELRFDLKDVAPKIDNVQIYGYADAGRVTNYESGPRSGSLASAGPGLRARLARNWDASVELGIPLTDGDTNENPKPRFSFTLRTTF